MIWRFLIMAATVWIGAYLVPGVEVNDGVSYLFLAAFVFGAVNAFIRPLAHLVTPQLDIVSLGLLTILINGFLVLITAALVDALSLRGPFSEQLVIGILATVIIAVVSTILSLYLPDLED